MDSTLAISTHATTTAMALTASAAAERAVMAIATGTTGGNPTATGDNSRAQGLLPATPSCWGRGLRSANNALLDIGAQALAGPKFTLLYRRWLKHSDAVFAKVLQIWVVN